MAKFTKADYRQFMIQITKVGKHKDLSGTFADALKGTATLKKANSILESKKQTYDYLIINVFRKFDICPDNLPSQLDDIWESLGDPVSELQNVIIKNRKKGVTGIAGTEVTAIAVSHWLSPLFLSSLIGPLGLVAGSVAYVAFVQHAVKSKWGGYKIHTLKLAEEYGEAKLNE